MTRKAILMDIDDHIHPPLPGRCRDRREPGEVDLIVDACDWFVGFPHEHHPDHVEPKVGHAVEVGRAGARLERGHLGVARDRDDRYALEPTLEKGSPRLILAFLS